MELPKASRTYDYEFPTVPVRCLADGCSFLAAGPSAESNHRMVVAHMIFAGQDETHRLASDAWLQIFDDDFDPLFDEAPGDCDAVLKKVRVPDQWLFGECPVPTCRAKISEACRERLYSHIFDEHDATEVDIFLGLRQNGGQASNSAMPVGAPGDRNQETTAETGPDQELKARWGGSVRRRRKTFAFEEWAHKKREQMRIETIRRSLKRKYAKEGNDIPAKGSPEYASWYEQIDQEARQQYETEVSNGGSENELRGTESVDDLLAINRILKVKLDNYVSEGNNIPNRRLREFWGFWQHMYKLACDELHQIKLRESVGGGLDGPDVLAQATQEMPMIDVTHSGSDAHIQTTTESAMQQLIECTIDQHTNSVRPGRETKECSEWLSSHDRLTRTGREEIQVPTDRLGDGFEGPALSKIREDIKSHYLLAGYTIPDLGTPEYLNWFHAVDKMARKVYGQDSETPELLIKQEPMCDV
ncbi:hypothetical protein V1525DRAFT_404049 [Lipomyces kononenkoae]|uniref:Uncharacterized protein n=1 Tax=Lipomyces kononenkoae TaxID=34357 RepID=A0ACC3T0T9_LIPKO